MRVAWLGWFCLVGLLLSARAHAGESDWSCDELPSCKKLSDKGLEDFAAGRFNEAQQRFAEAYAVRADPALLYNLGRALHKAGKPGEAVAYYQRFLDTGASGDEAQRRKAEQYQAQAQKEASPVAAPLSTLTPVPSAPASVIEKSRVPLYRRPWLWAVVGVTVAAGVAVGLGVGLASSRPDLTGAVEAHPYGN